MPDELVSVTSQGWGERLKNSLAGIVIGLILGVVAFPVLFLNEGRAVKRQIVNQIRRRQGDQGGILGFNGQDRQFL